MLVSQYELLINKRQFPKPSALPIPLPEELEDLSREVLQGYFLTISNLSDQDINLVVSCRVVSDAGESTFDGGNVAAVFDINGENQIVNLIATNPTTRNYVISLPAKDTGLFIVQPNPELITDATKEIEIRGYVDVSVLFNEGGEEMDLLLTPEHRGTFYKRIESTNDEGEVVTTGFDTLDQIAYTLPTANGGSLFKLS